MMAQVLNLTHHYGQLFFGPMWPVVWILVRIAVIVLPLLGMAAFLTLWERKVIGWMHARLGPNRVGPLGLLQPIADVFKILLKEIIVPEKADRFLFWLAPVLTIGPALAAWAVIPFGAEMVLADVNAGLLFLMAITSIGVYGIIIAGWASNSKYAFLGAVRASAQMISFGIPLGFVLVTVLLVSGSLNLSDIVIGQSKGFFASHFCLGTGFRFSRSSSFMSFVRLRKRDAIRSIRWKANRKSWPVIWWNIPGWHSPCSIWRNISISFFFPRWRPSCFWGDGWLRWTGLFWRGCQGGYGWEPKRFSLFSCLSGCAERFPDTVTTIPCVSAGRCSFRLRWCILFSSPAGCRPR